jgi:hypothetical protein
VQDRRIQQRVNEALRLAERQQNQDITRQAVQEVKRAKAGRTLH